MNEREEQKLRAYLDRDLNDLMDELELYDPASKGAGEVWNKVSAPVYQRLCVEWRYCQVRQDARFENDLDLAVAVGTALMRRVLPLPISVDLALITAIVVKRGVDAFCKCP